MSKLFSTFVFAALFILSHSIQAEPARVGTVIELKPKVQCLQGKDNKRLQVGGSLLAGDRLITSELGRVALVSALDGSVVRLGANSEMSLHVPDKGEGVLVRLVKGIFQAVVEKQGPHTFKVESAGGVAAVKGTQFQFEAKAGGSELKVLEGSVALSDAKGASSVAVAAGEAAMSYPDRVDSVRKMNAEEVKNLRGVFKELVDQKKKEYARRVREVQGKRSVPTQEAK